MDIVSSPTRFPSPPVRNDPPNLSSTQELARYCISFLSHSEQRPLSLASKGWYQLVNGRPFVPSQLIRGQSSVYQILSYIDRAMAHEIFEETGLEVPMTREISQGYCLGRGSFGSLHIGRGSNGYVAIKVTKSPDELEAKVQQELSGLPHLMPSLDYSLVEESWGKKTLYQVMPLAGLGSLESLRKQFLGLSDLAFREDLIRHIARGTMRGLKAMHGKDAYHLDVKPANLVIDGGGEVRLIDFGCVQSSLDAQCELGRLNFDRLYAPPECFDSPDLPVHLGKIDAWRAGLTLLLLCRQNPFHNTILDRDWPSPTDFARALQEIPELHNASPDSFEELIGLLLTVDPDSRIGPEEALQHPWLNRLGDRERAKARLREMIQATHRSGWTDRLLQDEKRGVNYARQVEPTVAKGSETGYVNSYVNPNTADSISSSALPSTETGYVNSYSNSNSATAEAVPASNSPRPSPALKEVGPSTAPLAHFTDYIDRPAIERLLSERLTEPPSIPTVCHGSGGVGKSQLALRLFYDKEVRKHHGRFLWFRAADDKRQLDTQYLILANELHLVDNSASAEHAVRVISKFLAEESERTGKPYLIVFDNADSPESLAPYLPVGGGHLLITTRNAHWEGAIPIEVFDAGQAVTLIEQLLGKTDPEASQLADALGYLPLGLVQACAYIRNHNTPISDYLATLTEKASELLEQNESLFGKSLPASIGALWEISFEKLQHVEGALSCLESLAYLAPDTVPSALVGNIGSPDAIQALADYSLIQKRDDNTFAMHRLLQLVARQKATRDNSGYRGALSAITATYQDPPQQVDRVTNWQLVPHGQSLLSHYDRLKNRDALLVRATSATHTTVGVILLDLGDVAGAKKMFESALENDERMYGLEAPSASVATASHNLGRAMLDLGDVRSAKKMFERALKMDQQIHGSAHQRVAIGLRGLGVAQFESGETRSACELFRQAVARDERAYGPNHPQLATDLGYVGLALRDLGETILARKMIERALKIDEKCYGSDHPKVAAHLHNLGDALRELGHAQEASTMLRRALAIDEKSYGLEHRSVAVRLTGLGLALLDLGEPAKAKHLFERALTIDETVYGPQHPRVGVDLGNMGLALFDLGALTEAKTMLEQALKIDDEVYGPAHPTTASHLNSLGLVVRGLGNPDDAMEFFSQAFGMYVWVHGIGHPRAANVVGNMGLAVKEMEQISDKTYAIHQSLIRELHRQDYIRTRDTHPGKTLAPDLFNARYAGFQNIEKAQHNLEYRSGFNALFKHVLEDAEHRYEHDQPIGGADTNKNEPIERGLGARKGTGTTSMSDHPKGLNNPSMKSGHSRPEPPKQNSSRVQVARQRGKPPDCTIS